MKNKLKMIALFFTISFTIFSQETPLRIDYTPQSPEVSSLFQFTDIVVGVDPCKV